jgi:putative ABC transport system substrate-binding protein
VSALTRRSLLLSLGGFAAVRPVKAQPADRTYRLCWPSTGAAVSAIRTEPYNVAFLERLHELGFTEGRNLTIELRSAEGRGERLPAVAAELARLGCDAFLAPGSEAMLAAIRKVSGETPIVAIANDYDLVAAGHVGWSC